MNKANATIAVVATTIGFMLGTIIQFHGSTKCVNVYKVDTVTVTKPLVKDSVRLLTKVVRIPLKKDTVVASGAVTTRYEQDTVTVELDRTQKHYSAQGSYDAWVSGIEPSLDSIKIYNYIVANGHAGRNSLYAFIDGTYVHLTNPLLQMALGLHYNINDNVSIRGGMLNQSTDGLRSNNLSWFCGIRYSFRLF